jgi:hypothetical protein
MRPRPRALHRPTCGPVPHWRRRLVTLCWRLSEAAMDTPSRVFKLIQLSGDWYWRLDIKNDDGLIGPFTSKDEAEKDARETLGMRDGER